MNENERARVALILQSAAEITQRLERLLEVCKEQAKKSVDMHTRFALTKAVNDVEGGQA